MKMRRRFCLSDTTSRNMMMGNIHGAFHQPNTESGFTVRYACHRSRL